MQGRWDTAIPHTAPPTDIEAVPGVSKVFVDSYREGKQNFGVMPHFLNDMCFVYANSLFEIYLTDLLLFLLKAKPRMLLASEREDGSTRQNADEGSEKKIGLRTVIDAMETGRSPLDRLINENVRRLMYLPKAELFAYMRRWYGFKSLDSQNDDSLYTFALARNCIVHNGSIADGLLEKVSKGFFQSGSRVHVDREFVTRAIAVFRNAAEAIDSIAIVKHQLVTTNTKGK